MSESKRAAVVKRGADREQRDMFAVGPQDLGSVKQTLHPPVMDASGGVAARNETSVLFTVDALRGSARVNTPPPDVAPLSTGFRVEEDEGIIDLKALASTPPTVGSRVVAPLFSEPPPAAFAADISGSSPAIDANGRGGFRLGKRAIAGIAAAAVALVLCTVGVAAAFRGEEPIARTNALMAPAALPPVVAAPPPAPAPEPAPPATASSSSDDDAKSSASDKKASKGKGKGKAKASFSANVSKVQSSGVAPVKPAPKAADKCGCKGDFNCVIRCTATGK